MSGGVANTLGEEVFSFFEDDAAQTRCWAVGVLTYLSVLGAHMSIMCACCLSQSGMWGLVARVRLRC